MPCPLSRAFGRGACCDAWEAARPMKRGGSPSPRLPRVSVARQAAREKTLSPEELEEQEEQEQAAGSPFRFRNEYLVALLVLIVAGTVFNPFQ